jgi:alpha-amylase
MDSGNGLLFKDYNPDALWWGLEESLRNHRYFKKNQAEWAVQMRRIMREAREKWSLDNMVAGYVTLYEQLNGGRPLA